MTSTSIGDTLADYDYSYDYTDYPEDADMGLLRGLQQIPQLQLPNLESCACMLLALTFCAARHCKP